MNGWQAFTAGIDPGHVPALVAGLLFPVGLVATRRLRGRTRALRATLTTESTVDTPRSTVDTPRSTVDSHGSTVDGAAAGPASLADRFAGVLLGVSAAVHLALPLGHHDSAAKTVAFVASAAGYGWVAWRALTGRRWRLLTAPLVLATLIAYAVVLGSGGEEPDQVGIATALIELAVLGLCLVPDPQATRRGWFTRALGASTFVLLMVVFGATTWVQSFAAHAASGNLAGGGHSHTHAARAQAGVVMAPPGAAPPTLAQTRGAADLAARTRAGLARFTDIHVAIAEGYRPTLSSTGLDVHLENKAYGKDGRILDPEHPELLMYAIADGKATLLSAVYQMPYATSDGPAPGGPLTRWHAHNICLTVLPPGISVVDSFGGCPTGGLTVTSAQMMHVWVVDEPGGPFADSAPATWTRPFNLAHGVPFHW